MDEITNHQVDVANDIGKIQENLKQENNNYQLSFSLAICYYSISQKEILYKLEDKWWIQYDI